MLQIAKYEIDVENKRKAHLKTVPEGELPRETVAALEKVLEHGRLAAQCKPNDSAKALYRMSQAFLIKEDYIEALDCLSKANGAAPCVLQCTITRCLRVLTVCCPPSAALCSLTLIDRQRPSPAT